MSKKVLVVDDSSTIREQVSEALASTGFDVVGAEDGLVALEKLNEEVVLVFCDVNMPRMNGLEMVEQVRRMDRYANLPIVMLTTEGRPELLRRAKNAGARAWIVKPFKPDHLVAVLRRFAS